MKPSQDSSSRLAQAHDVYNDEKWSSGPAHPQLQHPESLQRYKIETRDAGAVMREVTGNSARMAKVGFVRLAPLTFPIRGGLLSGARSLRM